MKLKAVISGVSTALIITVMGVVFISIWIMMDQGTAYYLPAFSMLMGIASCLVGGIKAAAKVPRGWWWQNGALVAVVYLVFTYLILNLLFPTTINMAQVSNWFLIILAGILGNLTGYYYQRTVAFRWKQKVKEKAVN